MKGLKNCPFCGSKAKIWKTNNQVYICCEKSGAGQKDRHLIEVSASTDKEAIEKWNKRIEENEIKKIRKGIDNGKEIVIIAEDERYNSAIFYKRNGKYRVWSREIGEVENKNMNDKKFEDHIKKMLDENAIIYIRG